MDNSSKSTSDDVIFQDINKYTRVTEILYPFSGLSNIHPDTVQNAARRGTKIHKICESIVTGLGDWGNDNESVPYVNSFLEWWYQGHNVVEVERRFFDDELGITGQVDMIIKEKDDSHSIVDLKTSYKPSKTWPLQGAAYAYLARNAGYNIQSIKFLHLNRTGAQAKMHVYEDQWDMFKKCLDVYNYFFKKSA